MDVQRAPSPQFEEHAAAQDGVGQDYMTNFVKGAMLGILQPFVENLHELHQHVGGLQTKLEAVTEKADHGCDGIAEHAALLEGFRTDLNAVTDRATAAEQRLDGHDASKATLDQEVVDAKARLDAVEARATSAESTLEGLQASMRNAKSSITRISEGLTKHDIEFQRRVDPALEKLNAAVAALGEAQASTENDLAGLRERLAALQEEVVANAKDAQATRSEHVYRMDQMDEQLTKLNIAIKDAGDALQGHTEELKTASASIASCKQGVESLESSHEGAKKRADACDVAMTDLKLRCSSIENNLHKLNEFAKSVGGEMDEQDSSRTGAKKVNIYQTVQELLKDVTRNKRDIEGLSATSSSQGDRIQSLEDCGNRLSQESSTLAHKVKQLEVQLGMDEPTGGSKESSTSQNMGAAPQNMSPPKTARVSMAAPELPAEPAVQSAREPPSGAPPERRRPSGAALLREVVQKMTFAAKQKLQERRMEEHDKQLSEHRDNLGKHTERLNTADGRLGALETNLAKAQEQLHSLGRGMNITQEYWKGLSKGLKEISHKPGSQSADQSAGTEMSASGHMRLPTLAGPK